MVGTKKRKSGRPKLPLSRTKPICPCGDTKGGRICKKGVDCLQCCRCNRACLEAGKYNRKPYDIRQGLNPVETCLHLDAIKYTLDICKDDVIETPKKQT